MSKGEDRPKKSDLEDRLVDFAAAIIDTAEALPSIRAGNHLAGQLIRCGTSPALNYGEAQGAESRKDFIHKMRGGLKELRETGVCLKIINRKSLIKPPARIEPHLEVCNELISIFVKSISTAMHKKK
jgi:four helix bundle protein